MNLTHAIKRATELCRQVAEPDFADRPLYVVPFTQARGFSARLACGNCLGWTLPMLDLILQPWLEPRGEWQGRGAAFVLRDDVIRNEAELIDVALHELAHALECGPVSTAPVPALLCAVESLPQSWESRQASAPSIDGHGWRFIRCAAHVRHRAASHGWRTSLAAMRVAGQAYAVSHGLTYERALGSEAAELEGLPIQSVLDSPAPRAFDQLWQRDLEARAA